MKKFYAVLILFLIILGATAFAANPGKGSEKVGGTVAGEHASDRALERANIYSVLQEPPIANAGADQTVLVGDIVTFDGSDSYDRNKDIASYLWDFGDGTTDSEEIVTHGYTRSDAYKATLTVTDNDGNTATDSLFVYVEDKTYVIDINYDSGGLSLNNAIIKTGFAPDRKIQPERGYRAELYSKSDKISYSFIFDIPRFLQYEELENNGTLAGGSIELDETNISLIIPYFENAKEIKIYDEDNNLKLTVNVENLPLQYSSDCKTINYSGNPAFYFDIVFVGDNYSLTDLPTLATDVRRHANRLLSVLPFSNNSNIINVHYVNVTSNAGAANNLGCYYNYSGIPRAIWCNPTSVVGTATQCPADEIIVIIKGNSYGGTAAAGFGGLNSYAMAYAGADPNLNVQEGGEYVTVHEIGHSFANLHDEYSYNNVSTTSPTGANCDNIATCTKWSSVSGTGCFAVCSYTDWYRPTFSSSLMRALTVSPFQYGPVSTSEMQRFLNGYRRRFCNASVPCQCGDVLTQSKRLNSSDFNTGPCSGDGLELGAAGISLDCNGIPIVGTLTSGSEGIKNSWFNNTIIKNCNVSNFNNGIHIKNIAHNVIVNNTVSSTSFVSGGGSIWVETSIWNNITQNTVSSYQWGIAIDINTNNNLIEENTISLSQRGIELYSSSGNIIKNNSVNNNAFSGIILRAGSTNNVIANNSAYFNNQHGLDIFDSISTGNTVNNNIFCYNNQTSGSYYDITDADANSGNNNMCSTTNNWNDTGTTGCTYSCPIISVDNPPTVTLDKPDDNYYNDTSQYVGLPFNGTCTDDIAIASIGLYTNYNGTWQVMPTSIEDTAIAAGSTNATFGFSRVMTNSTFIWNVRCCDNSSQCSFAPANRTVILNYTAPTIDNPPNITLISPLNNYYNDTQRYVSLTFTANCTDDIGLYYANLYTNYSGAWQINQTLNLTGTSQIFSFQMSNLTNKVFRWNIECVDVAGFNAWGGTRTVILNYTRYITPLAVYDMLNMSADNLTHDLVIAYALLENETQYAGYTHTMIGQYNGPNANMNQNMYIDYNARNGNLVLQVYSAYQINQTNQSERDVIMEFSNIGTKYAYLPFILEKDQSRQYEPSYYNYGIYFYVAEDGTTYYANSAHEYGAANLTASQAFNPQHLARAAQ